MNSTDATYSVPPAIMHEECCSGLMARKATLFPQPIGVAAAWVMLGSSSDDIRLTGSFRINGESALEVHKKVFFSDVSLSE